MSLFTKVNQVKVYEDDLHNHMIEDGLKTSWPFEEVVELGLEAAVSRVASRGAVAERLAKQRHPRRRQPVARAATLTFTATNAHCSHIV